MLRAALLTSIAVVASGCGAGGGSCSGGFCDKLTFGTGITGTGFTLVGETDTFSVATLGSSGQIWFRLESSKAFGNKAARLYINSPGTPPTPYWQKDYSGLQADAHLLLSTFRVTDKGTYDVVAYLVEQVGPDIGKETRVTNAQLVMTQ